MSKLATLKKIKFGDVGGMLYFTLGKSNGAVWDLSGVGTSVTLIFSGGNTPKRITKTCANLTSNGTCNYTFVAGDWTGSTALLPGKYKLECKITTATKVLTTVNQGDLEILEAL